MVMRELIGHSRRILGDAVRSDQSSTPGRKLTTSTTSFGVDVES